MPADVVLYPEPNYCLDYLLSPETKKYDTIPDTLLEIGILSLYEPQPRLTEGVLLSKHNLATSSIDSSDGLAISLHWIAQASNIGIVINNLPIHPELKSSLESFETILEITMFGGEEYELIFTIPPSNLGKIEQIFKKNNCNFFVIGECVDSQGVFVSQNEILSPVPMRGWDAFRKKIY